jgi:hypothetical protein
LFIFLTPCWKGVALCKAPTFFFPCFHLFSMTFDKCHLGIMERKEKKMHSKSGMFIATNISFFEMPHHM